MPEHTQKKTVYLKYQGEELLVVPAERGAFSAIESWIDEICEQLGVTFAVCSKIQIAADEIFSNICMYAYPADANVKEVDFSCFLEEEGKILGLEFRDKGIPFNPLQQQLPDPCEKVAQRQKGGLGIFILQKFADELTYEHRDGSNVLTFRKNITEEN